MDIRWNPWKAMELCTLRKPWGCTLPALPPSMFLLLFDFLQACNFHQARIYQELDCRQKTMKDFAVELKGLPGIAGDYKVVSSDLR